jgi:hypothetical protein
MLRDALSRRDFLQRSAGAAAGVALGGCAGDETQAPRETPAPPDEYEPEPHATLSVRGMQVCWNERTKRQDSHEPAASPGESWFTPADVARIRNAGATCIEIHDLGLPDLMPERGHPNEQFFTDRVDRWVDWCSGNGLECILAITGIDARADWARYLSLVGWLWDDLYASPVSKAEYDAVIRDFFDLDVAKQTDNRAAFVNLWAFMGGRYRDNPLVRFSIMNEPFCLVDVPDERTAFHLAESYSSFMEQVVDGIRSAGAAQAVYVDRPFLFDSSWNWLVAPVNRDGIVWESHQSLLPAFGGTTFAAFKAGVDRDVRQYLDEFQKPLFMGEFGIEPLTEIRKTFASDWRQVLAAQVAYLDSLPLAGRQYHCWDTMHGEYGSFAGDSNLTAAETDWIMRTVLAPG